MRHRAARKTKSASNLSARRNVYLIGLMGSGKSTVGRALARRLGWKFIDTDRVIEKMAGRSIRQIFSRDGEKTFRKIERRAIAATAHRSKRNAAGTMQKRGLVIAVGGGAVIDPRNVAVMKRAGTIVYLQVSPRAALRRVEKEGVAKRPLLPSQSAKKRLRVLKSLLRSRQPVYSRCCNFQIRSDTRQPAYIAQRIALRMAAFQEHNSGILTC